MNRDRAEQRRQRKQRHREHRRERRPKHAPSRRSKRSPEEQAYRAARRRANLKLSVAIHGVVFFLVLLMLVLVTRGIRVPMIVGGSWGILFGTHYFVALVAPRLRRRWITDEVGEQLHRGVTAQRAVVGDQHVRSLEDLSASIAHEIRNPVTAAKSLVQQMGEDPVSTENMEYARVALDELDRVERSISHLLKYARDEELHFEGLEMSRVIESAIESLQDRIASSSVEVDWQSHAAGFVRGDSEKLRRILINLVSNALDALEESDESAPRIDVACGENLAGNEVWVRVRDNGPGIPEETLRKIFSPFYTTKDRGTGLGLALSKKVVDAHGGALDVESSPGEGSLFVLTLPRFREGSPDDSTSSSKARNL